MEEERLKIEKVKKLHQIEMMYDSEVFFHAIAAAGSLLCSMLNILSLTSNENNKLLNSIALCLFALSTICQTNELKKCINERKDFLKKIALMKKDEKEKIDDISIKVLGKGSK